MTVEIKVPSLPESVADATVAKWYKKAGDRIERDENLVDLETDKVMLEVPAPAPGMIEKIIVSEGETVNEGQLLAIVNESGEKKKEAKEEVEEQEIERSEDPDKAGFHGEEEGEELSSLLVPRVE